MRLDHINLYVSNIARSRSFYERLLPPEGLKLNRDFGEIAVGFGDRDYAVLALVAHQEPIQSTHLAFRVEARTDVDRLYNLAIEAGGTDNGLPGMRSRYHENYYAGFVLDPDGHNLEFVCHEPTDA